jgi:EAL domain-containing protein (putative c-di-GMP-specific phosphodiesterase class I)
LSLLWDAGVEYVQGDYIQAPTTNLDLPTQAALVDEGPVDVESVRLSLRL